MKKHQGTYVTGRSQSDVYFLIGRFLCELVLHWGVQGTAFSMEPLQYVTQSKSAILSNASYLIWQLTLDNYY